MYLLVYARGIIMILVLMAGIILDAGMMMLLRIETQGALDAAVIAGTTQQRQVVLATDPATGAPMSWTYEVDVPAAQVLAQQTLDKNLSQSPHRLYDATVNGPDWNFPTSQAMRGTITLTATNKASESMYEGFFQTVSSTIPTTTIPISARAEVPNTVYP